jgi:hypothetical protein
LRSCCHGNGTERHEPDGPDRILALSACVAEQAAPGRTVRGTSLPGPVVPTGSTGSTGATRATNVVERSQSSRLDKAIRYHPAEPVRPYGAAFAPVPLSHACTRRRPTPARETRSGPSLRAATAVSPWPGRHSADRSLTSDDRGPPSVAGASRRTARPLLSEPSVATTRQPYPGPGLLDRLTPLGITS